MVGPVLYQEMLLGSRAGKQYIFRWIYAGWLILQILFYSLVASIEVSQSPESFVTARLAAHFIPVFVVQQLILMIVAVPAFAAGSVTDEKTRGTLQHMLTTDLESRHIILGKLLAKSAQVLVLFLTGLPLLCFLGVIDGLEPLALVAVAIVTLLPLLALASATLLASVWSTETRNAVLCLYAVGLVGGILVAVIGGPLQYFYPLYVLEPAWGNPSVRDIQELGRRLLWSGAAWGSIMVVCLGLAMWRLRPAYIRQLQNQGKAKKARWWHATRAPLDAEPIPWKEQNVEGLAPVNSLRRFPRWLAITAIAVITCISSATIIVTNIETGKTHWDFLDRASHFDLMGLTKLVDSTGQELLVTQARVALFLASLIVGIRCSGAVCGERERRTWEALLLTPLTAKQLIRGKLWGIMGASYAYLLAYAVPAILFSALGGQEALFWTVLWLVVTLLAMYFLGATGLYCSVRARTSWRSLLSTMGIAYVGGALIQLVLSPVILLLALVMWLVLAVMNALLEDYLNVSIAPGTGPFRWMGLFAMGVQIASAIGLAGMFFFVSRYFLADAQRWVAERERTRFWHDDPSWRRPRRYPARARSYQ
jgi:ABC-type transport system involved in multi-copper enzyme maturation permease subunit